MLKLPEGSWQRPAQGDNHRFVPTFCTLTRDQRPPGFDRLQHIIKSKAHDNSTEKDKDEARITYAAAIMARLSPWVESAVKFMVEQGDQPPELRKMQFESLKAIAEDLRPLADEIRSKGPARLDWVQGENPAFIAAMIDAVGLPNKDFVKNMYITGFETTGVAQLRLLWRIKTDQEIKQSLLTMNIK